MPWSLAPQLVRDAAARLAPLAHETPLRHSPALSAHVGADVFLKLETEQAGGSFKVRGAINVIATLDPSARAAGVVASSAGNHGTGVALAAQAAGVSAVIFVPRDAPAVKKRRIRDAGAELRDVADDYDHAQALGIAFAHASGRHFISPCTGTMLIAGQGTVGLELTAQCPTARSVVVCVGGGGLLGGVGGWLRATRPDVRIVGAQGERTNAMAAALAAGRLVDVPVPPTLADGLAGQIDAEGLAIGQATLDHLALVTEDEIADAIRWLHAHEGLAVEGAGAVSTAALLTGKAGALDGPIVATVSGGNIDPARLDRLLAGATAHDVL
jgi:threonine dehydratase